MGPHIVDILQQGLSIVLDSPANTVSNRNWMRSLITQADVAHAAPAELNYIPLMMIALAAILVLGRHLLALLP
jgi:branched-subunit amino acid ABC-type transport system permease component